MGFIQKLFTKQATEQPLSGSELLDEAYSTIIKRNFSSKVSFDLKTPPKDNHKYYAVNLIIADDSDDHRNRTGEMSYDSADIISFGNQDLWIIAKGIKTGSYPGSEYAADIFAMKAAEDLELLGDEELISTVKNYMLGENLSPHEYFKRKLNEPFSRSIIVAMADGRIAFPQSNLGSKLTDLIREPLKEQIYKPVEHDERFISPNTLQSMVKSGAKYKPQAVGIVVEGIETVLRL